MSRSQCHRLEKILVAIEPKRMKLQSLNLQQVLSITIPRAPINGTARSKVEGHKVPKATECLVSVMHSTECQLLVYF